MTDDSKRIFYNKEQDRRIQAAVNGHERKQPYTRPQAIKPRFVGGRPGVPLIRFQLVEDLTLGGHAEAQLLKLSHPSSSYIVDEDADHIEVYDIFRRNPSGTSIEGIESPGMWAGNQYMQGWAQKRKGSTPWNDTGGTEGTDDDETREKYDIVWMEQLASSIMFQTTGPVYNHEDGGLAVPASVIRYDLQGINPAEYAESETGEITIHVPFYFQDSIGSDAFGLAEYDYSDRKYYVHEIMRVAIFATATITEDLCGNEWPSGDVDISGFSVIPHGWHTMNPPTTPTTAQNSYGHAGPSGSKVLLLRIGLDSLPSGGDNDDQKYRWEIINIVKREMNVVFDVKFGAESSTTGIYYKERTCRMEWCDPETPEAWQLLVSAANCDGTED